MLQGAPRFVVVARTDLLVRSGARVELLARMERAGLLRPIGKSPTEVYYPREAFARVERVQTLIAAGYAERDVAHVVGKVAEASVAAVERVIALDTVPDSQTLPDGLVPLWGRDDSGRRLIRLADLPLCQALLALAAVGLPELAPELSAALVAAQGGAHEALAAAIEPRLEALEGASATLRATLAKLKRSRRGTRTARLKRLLRRPKAG